MLIPPLDEIDEPDEALTLDVADDTPEFLFVKPEPLMEPETLSLAVRIVLATTSSADTLTELFS